MTEPGPEATPTDPLSQGLMESLRTMGTPEDEIRSAAQAGPQQLIVLFADRAFVPGEERLTRLEVAQRAGTTLEEASAFWRALGFADVPDDARIFTEVDVEMVRRVSELISGGIVDADLALQTTRVMGRAGAQVAAALIDIARRSLLEGAQAPQPVIFTGAPALLDDLDRWVVYVWRRHAAAEAQRAALQAGAQGTAVVGFADLVGFSGISQSLEEAALAAAVAEFESTAVDLVGRHGGRIVKMIGDEVMFEAPSPRAGAEIALDLVETFAEKEELPDVRVGLAFAPATRHQGDLFGEAPNLASRLVEEAYPATILASESIHEALTEEEDLLFKAVRPHRVKGFGRIRFWVLRRAGDEQRRAWKIPILDDLSDIARERLAGD